MSRLQRHTRLKRGLKPMRYRSAKTAAERADAQAVIDKVYARDGGCLLAGHDDDPVVGPCRGVLTPHHLRKDGQGGAWSPGNIVTLCAGHNSWVEDHPVEAWTRGLVIKNGETTAEAWEAMATAGLAVVAGSGGPCSGGGSLTAPLHRGPVATCDDCGQVVSVDAADDGGPGGELAAHVLLGVA